MSHSQSHSHFTPNFYVVVIREETSSMPKSPRHSFMLLTLDPISAFLSSLLFFLFIFFFGTKFLEVSCERDTKFTIFYRVMYFRNFPQVSQKYLSNFHVLSVESVSCILYTTHTHTHIYIHIQLHNIHTIQHGLIDLSSNSLHSFFLYNNDFRREDNLSNLFSLNSQLHPSRVCLGAMLQSDNHPPSASL